MHAYVKMGLAWTEGGVACRTYAFVPVAKAGYRKGRGGKSMIVSGV